MVGVDSENNIYYREGMSTSRPTGTSWRQKQGKMMQIEVYRDRVVGITERGVVISQSVD